MAGKEIQFKSGDGSSNVGGDLKLTAGAGNGENKKGGDLVLSTGISTGNQSAAITLLTSVSGDTGEDDRDPAERMRIHTNGYVGIGTNAPGTLLQLEGADAYLTLKNTTDEHGDGEAETKIIFEDHGNNSLALIQASHDGTDSDAKGDLILSTNNNSGLQEGMRIDSSQNTILAGNLTSNDLIFVDDANSSHNLTLTANQTGGTNTLTLKVTSNSTLTVDANLDVESASTINQDVTTDATPTFASTTLNKADSGGDVTVNFQQGGTTAYTIGIDDTDNKFKIHSGTALANTSDLTIDSSGNIGLGTASPVSKLHLSSGVGANGDCEITIQTDTDNDGSNESSNPRLVLNQDGGNVKSYFSHGANILGIYNCAQANGGIVFGISTQGSSTINSNTSDQNISATTEVMRISNDLKVGIGTNDPGTLLQVEGSDAYITLKNTSDEHGNGEAETKIIFEDHGNNILAQIQASHDGTDDDCKGDLILSTNNGSNATSLITALTINSLQYVGIGTSDPLVKLEIRSDATQLRLTDNSDSSRYADIFQNNGHFTIKTYNSASDIVLDTKGNDIQFNGNGTFFGGIAKNSNNLLLYSYITNQSITFKTSVSGSSTQILELNKSNNLATFDSNIKLNGSLSYNLITNGSTSSPYSSSTISINFNTTNAGDFYYILNESLDGSSVASYILEYSEITSSDAVGKHGLIILSRPSGGSSSYTPQVDLDDSMTSPSRHWVTETGNNVTSYFYHDSNKMHTYIHEYYIFSTTQVFIKTRYYEAYTYTGT